MEFFETLSQKYLDLIKDVKVFFPGPDMPWPGLPILRNLKVLSIPTYCDSYQQAKVAKKGGLLFEEFTGIKQLLLLRGLTTVIIEDKEEIPKDLLAIKRKVDALITNTIKRPRKLHGRPAFTSMDTFSK